MKSLDPQTRRELHELARRRLAFEGDYRVTPWIRVLWPWGWVLKAPLPRSVLVGAVALAVVLVTNLGRLSGDFVLKQALMACEISIGFWCAHWFSSRTQKMYEHLATITLLPRDTFRRWFAERVSVPWGRVNTRGSVERESYTLRDTWTEDREILLWYGLLQVPITLLAWSILDLPRLGDLDLGGVVQYLFVAGWGLTWVWTMHFVVVGIPFLVSLARMPIRYFYGMPDGLTFKRIGDRVVQINYGNAAHFLVLLGVFYTWDAIPRAFTSVEEIGGLRVLLLSVAILGYSAWGIVMGPVATQVALTRAMRSYKARRQAEYSNFLERKFDAFMTAPNPDRATDLNEAMRNMRILKRLPTLALSPSHLVVILLIFVGEIAAMVGYFLLAFRGWDNLVAFVGRFA